jgi:hypothetical protein
MASATITNESLENGRLNIENEFNSLAQKWREETAFLSLARQKAMHPAYQKIIGMGREALPLIFKELQIRGGDWIWALEMIVRKENPAAGKTNYKEAIEAWLSWGKQHGFAS